MRPHVLIGPMMAAALGIDFLRRNSEFSNTSQVMFLSRIVLLIPSFPPPASRYLDSIDQASLANCIVSMLREPETRDMPIDYSDKRRYAVLSNMSNRITWASCFHLDSLLTATVWTSNFIEAVSRLNHFHQVILLPLMVQFPYAS